MFSFREDVIPNKNNERPKLSSESDQSDLSSESEEDATNPLEREGHEVLM